MARYRPSRTALLLRFCILSGHIWSASKRARDSVSHAIGARCFFVALRMRILVSLTRSFRSGSVTHITALELDTPTLTCLLLHCAQPFLDFLCPTRGALLALLPSMVNQTGATANIVRVSESVPTLSKVTKLMMNADDNDNGNGNGKT
jgi:hypothetical protein